MLCDYLMPTFAKQHQLTSNNMRNFARTLMDATRSPMCRAGARGEANLIFMLN